MRSASRLPRSPRAPSRRCASSGRCRCRAGVRRPCSRSRCADCALAFGAARGGRHPSRRCRGRGGADDSAAHDGVATCAVLSAGLRVVRARPTWRGGRRRTSSPGLVLGGSPFHPARLRQVGHLISPSSSSAPEASTLATHPRQKLCWQLSETGSFITSMQIAHSSSSVIMRSVSDIVEGSPRGVDGTLGLDCLCGRPKSTSSNGDSRWPPPDERSHRCSHASASTMAATASTKTNLDEQLAWLAQNQSATLRPPAGVPPPAPFAEAPETAALVSKLMASEPMRWARANPSAQAELLARRPGAEAAARRAAPAAAPRAGGVPPPARRRRRRSSGSRRRGRRRSRRRQPQQHAPWPSQQQSQRRRRSRRRSSGNRRRRRAGAAQQHAPWPSQPPPQRAPPQQQYAPPPQPPPQQHRAAPRRR